MGSRILRMALTIAAIGAGVVFASACNGSGDKPEITVAAAADLRVALNELAPTYEQTCTCKVTLTYGSSGTFATQIKEGLPADVFASANISYVDDLDSAGLIVSDTKQLYAVGRIVVAFPSTAARAPGGLSDLVGPDIRKVSIANPEHAPYGVAAKEALIATGLWAQVEPHLVLAENAAQATQFVETGDAQAGIVPLSLAIRNKNGLKYKLIDDSLHAPLRQAGAVLKRSKHQDIAAAFLKFINGPEGRSVMKKYGFVLPGEEAP